MVAGPLVKQRDIWLADLPEPTGSEAGYRRPVVIVQIDALNASKLTTYLAVPLTGLQARQVVPWNLHLPAKLSGLRHDSVAQTNLLLTVDDRQLIEPLGRVTPMQLTQLFARLDLVLGRA